MKYNTSQVQFIYQVLEVHSILAGGNAYISNRHFLFFNRPESTAAMITIDRLTILKIAVKQNNLSLSENFINP